ncbi:hypothetical protein X777_13374 [Ooceraea biroi]|uniref:Uncharacterized protein n=1 Tax=Ooceraea biroi TaxID=2015173 RepID=A0A026WW25_OOCBI|nr:hypothetical protein X777_13374 [Ooceraea biroi]
MTKLKKTRILPPHVFPRKGDPRWDDQDSFSHEGCDSDGDSVTCREKCSEAMARRDGIRKDNCRHHAGKLRRDWNNLSSLDPEWMVPAGERMAAGKIPQPANKLPMARSRTNGRQSGVDTPAGGCTRQIRAGGCVRYALQRVTASAAGPSARPQLFPQLFV